MSFWRGLLLWLALAALFVVINLTAYRGFFMDDDLDNLPWTRDTQSDVWIQGITSLRYSPQNFRPAGHYFYRFMSRAFELNFKYWVVGLHLLHMVNVFLLWMVLRRLGATLWGAAAGALFFAIHAAAFDAYYKVMFVFDVSVTFWILLTLLLYLHDHWIVALIPFWFAYKSKELAITLPAVLLLYEFMLGEKRWKRVIPFAAIAGSFTLQAAITNRATDNAYTLRFTPGAFWKCLSFYAANIFLIPFAGFVLIPLAWFVKDKRVRFGIISIVVFLGPLLFLPGRLFSVYLYLPLIAAAVAVAFLAGEAPKKAVIIAFTLWLPWMWFNLDEQRKPYLEIARENKVYVLSAGEFMRRHPDVKTIIFDGGPKGMARWGIVGSFRWYTTDAGLQFMSLDDDQGRANFGKEGTAVVSWNQERRRMSARVGASAAQLESRLDMRQDIPVNQLGRGWFPLEDGFRWTEPVSKLTLRAPPGAKEFELQISLGPMQKKDMGKVPVEVLLNGQSLGKQFFVQEGLPTARWKIPPNLSGSVEAELRVDPAFRPSNGDPRVLGIAVVAVGFP
jgi:hypothetical protein